MRISVIAHNIRSTHNVGSIFRTCDGFGIAHLYLSGYTPAPKYAGDRRLPHIADKLHAQIHKTALGAEGSVPFSYHAELQDAIGSLPDDATLVALEQSERSVALPKYVPEENAHLVILLGEEVNGIPADVLTKCKTVLEIPMYGAKESFNVSVATGIALYSLRERRRMLQSSV